MYPQVGFQILDEILPFFAKKSQNFPFLDAKEPFFLGYIRIQLAYWKV
jgi:hypothetical protein